LYQSQLDEKQIDCVLQTGSVEAFDIPPKFVDQCERFIRLLNREATRASISYENLVNRAEHVPTEVDLTDEVVEERQHDGQVTRDLEIALFVEKLKEYMSPVELSVCESIMNDVSYAKIAEGYGKSTPWVSYTLDKLKQKLTKRLKDGTITL